MKTLVYISFGWPQKSPENNSGQIINRISALGRFPRTKKQNVYKLLRVLQDKERGVVLVLTLYEWIYGISQISVLLLSGVAGVIALSLFSSAKNKLYPWRYLLFSLVMFAVVIALGVFRTFGVYDAGPWTHILVGVILASLIAALITQIEVSKGWL